MGSPLTLPIRICKNSFLLSKRQELRKVQKLWSLTKSCQIRLGVIFSIVLLLEKSNVFFVKYQPHAPAFVFPSTHKSSVWPIYCSVCSKFSLGFILILKNSGIIVQCTKHQEFCWKQFKEDVNIGKKHYTHKVRNRPIIE